MNLYGFYAGTSSFSSRIENSRTENTEKLCTFSEGSLYLYSENPFSSWRSELGSCTWIKLRLKSESVDRAFQMLIDSISDGEIERKSEIYT